MTWPDTEQHWLPPADRRLRLELPRCSAGQWGPFLCFPWRAYGTTVVCGVSCSAGFPLTSQLPASCFQDSPAPSNLFHTLSGGVPSPTAGQHQSWGPELFTAFPPSTQNPPALNPSLPPEGLMSIKYILINFFRINFMKLT